MSGRFDPERYGPIRRFFRKYGLAFVMVASYFGSGSIFIASDAGLRYGYSLIWAAIAATVIGLFAQDMSARVGIFGGPLMSFVRRKLGQPLALLIALWLSFGCILWTLELTAAVGAGLSQLLGGAIGWQPLAVFAGLMAILAGIRGYDALEHLMTGMMVALLLIYVVVGIAAQPDPAGIVAGLFPGAELGQPGAIQIGRAHV